jgi:hypothetical protein
MRRSVFACGLLLALAGISSVVSTAAGGTEREPTVQQHEAPAAQTDAQRIAYWSGEARHARAKTAHWLTVVRGRPPRAVAIAESSSLEAARDLAQTWHRRAKAASRLAHNPPKLKIWYCIHSYEGSWSDPNAPYWGGLQMDYNFQSAYGAWLLKHKGTANHWAPLAQIWAGVRAWRVRGFSPWANTARACGAY